MIQPRLLLTTLQLTGSGIIVGHRETERVARPHHIARHSSRRICCIFHRWGVQVGKVATGSEEAAADASTVPNGSSGKHARMTEMTGSRHRQRSGEGWGGARGGQIVPGRGGTDDAAVDGRWGKVRSGGSRHGRRGVGSSSSGRGVIPMISKSIAVTIS